MYLQTPPTVTTSLREFLAFKLGNEEYGIDILRVQEIRSYEPPTRLVPIIDMRMKFSLPECCYNAFTVVIVLNIGARVVAWWWMPSATSSH